MSNSSSKAGKGMKPLAGVDWAKQYENSPFLSPWEKRLLTEELEEATRQDNIEWAKEKHADNLRKLSEFREEAGM